jgi:hypothetical protein
MSWCSNDNKVQLSTWRKRYPRSTYADEQSVAFGVVAFELMVPYKPRRHEVHGEDAVSVGSCRQSAPLIFQKALHSDTIYTFA